MNLTQFASPPMAYRGVTLWMLNDRLELDEIERQLRDFAQAGWGAVITRTFDGLMTPYLGEQWKAVLRRIVDTAQELGIKVWFQAGYMPGGIPELEPDFEQQVLVAHMLADMDIEGECLAEDDVYRYVKQRLDHHLDLLNKDAVRSYLRQAYEEPWFKHFEDAFGQTIETIWVDEPSFRPQCLPWTTHLPAQFQERWGYDLVPHLPALFQRTGDFVRIRHHYWRTVLDLFLKAYFEQVSAWCEEHGVLFGGHLMGEDTLVTQISWTAAAMPEYAYMQLPGIDHLTRSLTWSHGETWERSDVPFILTPKQCSSVANQLGKKAALAEMYGVSSEGITFEDRKWISDWFQLLGINYKCIHGSFYSLRGRRKRIYVPHVSYQQPWWADNRLIADYISRVSYVLRQGQPVNDVLILHPIESAFGLFDPLEYAFSRPEDAPSDIVAMNDELVDLSLNVQRIHRGFDYGDETILAEHGWVEGSEIVVGDMRYRAVLLPSTLTLRTSTVDLLKTFVAQSGAVYVTGTPPTRVDGVEDRHIETVFEQIAATPEALEQALEQAAPAQVQIQTISGDAGLVWLHARETDEGLILFLANTSRRERIEIELTVKSGTLEHWNLETGRIEAQPQKQDHGRTTTHLVFEPTASYLLVCRRMAAVPTIPPQQYKTRTLPIQGPWQIERSAPNALVLDMCRLKRPGQPWTPPLPVIGIQEVLTQENYDGPIQLEFTFEARAQPQHIELVVEQADEWDITTNGQPTVKKNHDYYLDRTFHRLDIAGQVQTGKNTITLAREFSPLRRPDFQHAGRFQNIPGVELEPIYVIGDFSVRGTLSPREQKSGCVRLAQPFWLGQEVETTTGNLITDGYPFFAGAITLRTKIEVNTIDDSEPWTLTLPRLDACLVHIAINGQNAGTVAWRPYEIEITPWLKQGTNTISLTLTNTLRNLIGPHHRPQGELEHTWGENAFSGRYSEQERQAYPEWYMDRAKSDVWTDDVFVVRFGVAEGVELRIKERDTDYR